MKPKKHYQKQEYIYKDEEEWYSEDDIYSEANINELVEWDEISDEEAGFMMGYIEEE
ncbi:hypothetical protein HYX18_01040 [Candidatus Woesearchaeota archaeon]|nr:hypothetical protein [Candidatus Woesearchaeota archaeon]